MALGLHAAKDLCDASIGRDDERRSEDAHVLAPEQRLLSPDPVALGDGVIRVGNERERQIVLLLELLVRLDRIGADAEDGRIESLELREGVAKLARLYSSTRRVVFRIEVQDHRSAA